MARVASRGEAQCCVIRICGALVILQVARYAGRASQRVVVVDVAIGTRPRWNGVHSSERESRAVVIERRIHPVGGVVTGFAGLREIRGGMVRIGGALEIFQVARNACRAV